MGKTNFHLCQSIKGPFSNWTDAEWKNALEWMLNDKGEKFQSIEDLKQAFVDELAQGHELIPIGDCDNFDWKTGCKGHPVEDEAND